MSSARPRKPAGPDPGTLAVRFIENLTLVGDFHGEKFRLRDWQKAIVRPLFGTLLKDGRRQYRRMFLGIPRKQAKTTLTAGIAGFLLFGECRGRKGKRIYSASGDHKQAALIFDTLASMVETDPALDRLCRVYHGRKAIECPSLDNTFEAVSSDAKLKHGLSPSEVLFDEVHVFPNRQLHDVLTTGFGARREPLAIYITTAGWDRLSLCHELWENARKVRDGILDDPTLLPILYEASPDDDWTDEAVWRRVMPALGDFCQLEFLRDEFRRAKESPGYENTFKQLYLNIWTEQATRWIAMERWLECGVPTRDDADLAGAACYGGLDLSQTRDLTAFALAFPADDGSLDVKVRQWAPEQGVWRKDHTTRERYLQWARQGVLTLTPGEVIDYQFVEEAIVELSQDHDLRTIFADRAMALQLCLRLRDVHGLAVEFLPQTPMGLNSPIRELERLVLARQVRHGNNPLLNWNASNASVRTNSTGLVTLDKSASSGKIDGLAATVNALAALAADPEHGDSIYESRGILAL